MPEFDTLLLRIEEDLDQFRRRLRRIKKDSERSAASIGRSLAETGRILGTGERRLTNRGIEHSRDGAEPSGRFGVAAKGAATPGLFSRPSAIGTLLGSAGLGRVDLGGAGDDALRLNERLLELGDSFRDLGIEAKKFAKTHSGALDDLTRKTGKARGATRSLRGAVRDLGSTFVSAFERALTSGRSLSEVLRGLALNLLRRHGGRLITSALNQIFASVFHGGGVAGGPAPRRLIDARAFAGAPRFQGGGVAGGAVPRLAPNEVPAILHRGETVRTPAQEAALARTGNTHRDAVTVNVTIQTPNPQAFTESRGQIQSLLRDAVMRGQRNR